MNTAWVVVLILICVGVGLWLLSFILEALRRAPETPKQLSWAPDIGANFDAQQKPRRKQCEKESNDLTKRQRLAK